MAILAIFLSAVIAVACGLLLAAAVPEMTAMQRATWAGAVFALVCAPSLSAIIVSRAREAEDDETDA